MQALFAFLQLYFTTNILGGKESTTLKEISETLGKETIDLYNTSDEEMYSFAVFSAEKLKRISDVEFRRMDLSQYDQEIEEEGVK